MLSRIASSDRTLVISRLPRLRRATLDAWLRDTPRERLAEIYGKLAELVAHGVMGAEVEAAYRLDQFSVALAHAQRAERSGKVLVTPAVQTA